MNTLVRMSAESTRTRVLITQGSRDIGKAILPPASGAHPRAMATLLEGLSLFLHERLSVVLCVDERSGSYASVGLLDALGYSLELPARPDRPARVARTRVRARPVEVVLKVGAKRRETVKLNAVLATEVHGPKTGSLRWMLLTTSPIETLEQVIDVVDGYTYRWRIEEFHRAWKSGGCNVEDTNVAAERPSRSGLRCTPPWPPALSVSHNSLELAPTCRRPRSSHNPRSTLPSS